jgi:hypothetical protein
MPHKGTGNGERVGDWKRKKGKVKPTSDSSLFPSLFSLYFWRNAMDPISLAVEVELGSLLLSVVGVIAAWLGYRRQHERYQQRLRHALILRQN